MNEKMRRSEAETVVRAYRAERGSATNVGVARLAEALGTDVGEVRRLARGRRFTDGSGLLSAGIALILVLGTASFAGPRLLRRYPAFANASAHRPSITILAPSASPRLALDGTSKEDDTTKIAFGDDLDTKSGTTFRDDEPL